MCIRDRYKCILDLMDAVDDYIPTPERKADQPFLMPVEEMCIRDSFPIC